jgi:C1A family cysteine protease
MLQEHDNVHAYMSLHQLEKRVNHKHKPVLEGPMSTTPAPLTGSVQQYCPPVYNQLALGSCTANAFCGAYDILSNRLQTKDAGWLPSRLWCYYFSRAMEHPNTPPSQIPDDGANVADTEKYVEANGMCSEILWPYVISTFDATPTAAMLADAPNHKIKSYAVIPLNGSQTAAIENTIAAGSPVLMAFLVYSSFESQHTATTGFVTMPLPGESILGGHEVVIVGYNHTTQIFTIMNSWGPQFGAKGFVYFPYAYIANSQLTMQLTVISL